MKLAIVRHSMSVANHADLISGGGSDATLSDAGRAYAKQVAAARDWAQYHPVYVSPMTRARETAELITGGARLIVEPRLAEMHFGDWEGLHADDLRAQYPDAFDYTGMFDVPFSKYAPNAESYADLIARERALVDELLTTHPDDAVLLVTHGMTIRALGAAIFDADVFGFGNVGNLALTEVEFDGRRPRLLRYNETLVPRP